MKYFCIECGYNISTEIYDYSLNHFSHPLCRIHQDWIRALLWDNYTTQQTIDLYLALKTNGVPAVIEKFDGYKHIDIAIPKHKFNIEIDGMHHHYDSNQALRDLKRTYHSFRRGYFTIRVPNTLVDERLNEAVEYIIKFLNESMNQQ
ncbi:endonuclease domain-containing protein [Flavobacterium lacisediminis]|uniref:Endonuclease domain-containing protein n=1 Tax=Flavobacterium lacisediminis TaxID=2989705 RepID=A0ABT3EKT0_9FLAO|nr:endonuclease domain-containing protein [Flavobacterium lacisediminis]MCW1149163.1 endonuclease domain-containing protein [Flavobacterium lacisediminis]